MASGGVGEFAWRTNGNTFTGKAPFAMRYTYLRTARQAGGTTPIAYLTLVQRQSTMVEIEEEKPELALDVLRPTPVLRLQGKEMALSTKGDVSLAVLIYLIITRKNPTPREELLRILGDRPGAAPSREHFRGILHGIRKKFGEAAITGEQELQWTLPVDVDAERLVSLTPETMEDDLLRLYHGDFLAEWKKLRYADGFQEWAGQKRDDWRNHAFKLLDARARALAAAGEWERVASIGRRIAEIRPDLEEGYAWEIKALEELNQFTAASERYAEAARVVPAPGGALSSSLARLGERVRLLQEEEMARRVAEPSPIQEDGARASAPNIAVPTETATEAVPQTQLTTDTPIIAELTEITAADPAGGRAPVELLSPSALDRPSAAVASLTRLWLAGGAILLAAFVILILVFRPDAGADGASVRSPGVVAICRNGTGRGALVREVYHAGEGVDAGAEFTKAWYLLNDGECSWAPDFLVIRQSPRQRARGHFIVGSDTIRLGRKVSPGDSAVVRIRMRAPDLHGFLRERWSIFDATGGTIDIEGSPYLPVSLIVRKRPVPLCRPEEVIAELIATNHENRQAVPVGSEFIAAWTLINPRLCTWPAETRLRRKESSAGVLSGDTSVVSTGDVLPGEMVTVRVPIRTPAHTGVFGEEWELTVGDGEARPISDAPSVWIRIQSASPGETAQLRAPRCGPGQAVASFQSETIRDNTTLPPDQPFEKTWTLRNAAGCRWEAPMKLRLNRSTGARLSLEDEVPVHGMVMPGMTYTFTVRSRTPLRPGTYSEYWQLIGPSGEVVPIPNQDEVWVIVDVRQP